MTDDADTSLNVASETAWFRLTPEDVKKRLDVDPMMGLSAAKAAELLQKNGPERTARRGDDARLEAVLGSVSELHADHPRRGRRCLDADR